MFLFYVRRWKSSLVIGGDTPVSGGSAQRGVGWLGGVRWAVSLSKALWVGGPVSFATPDVLCSHPTARGQSKPHHIREREGERERIPDYLKKL